MNCPVCNGSSMMHWGDVGRYAVMACSNCGLGITTPFPAPEELASVNAENYRVTQRIDTYLSRQNYFERRYRRYVARIKALVPGGALLDVGCNIGLFLKVAREQGFSVTGVELNSECADFGASHFSLEIHSDYLEKLRFPENSFNVVTLFDVLEHIPDMRRFLNEISRILRDNGVLVVQSPNISSLMARLTGSAWNWLTPPDHIYHFTPEALTRLLRDNGFEVAHIRSWEPAREFALNFLLANKSRSFFIRLLFGLEKASRLVSLFVFLVQRVWWRRMRGGLLEVYAVKPDGA